MKTLELANRKNTTEAAKNVAIEMIESFNFSSDIKYVKSKEFRIIRNDCNRAYFELYNGIIKLNMYDIEMGDCEETSLRFGYMNEAFNERCTYVNFRMLSESFEDFIEKINITNTEKDKEIAEFLEFCEGWKSYKNTARIADEIESKTENL